MIEILKKYRRDLHRIPELGHQEFKTHEYILNVLKGCDCEISEFSPTGICAFFRAENPRHAGAVAFRSDMDALPIEEAVESPFRSTHKGMMHACGHDGHMAMLLGLAKEINEMRGNIPVNALLIFQPAEESPGGAKAMVDSGILGKYDVRRIFAFHLGPSDKPGSILTRPLEMMARSSELTITIDGKSAHIATPHKGIDALQIGCLFINTLYEMEKIILPSEEFRLLRFGKMSAGTVRNTIANHALLEGTLRTFREDAFTLLKDKIHSISTDYESQYGCTVGVHYTEGYPAIINDPELFRLAKDALSPPVFPSVPEFITLRKPPMTSDDFSYFMQEIPGLYMFLGTGNKKPLHSSDFDFDEEVLVTGVKAYIRLLQLPL